ncbi:hypothetical protein FNH22_06655 [Fulvivirga sp. M361]|uniref:hypothetical protein n=1 Tax=Fulvivirga sp. M361 TaxID=2594266 RepID=UPI00117B81F7|nr:hypothetical protein [Fulvivirga sp. M361]TRX60719.1 hypothetical protein FNH22_06655 [Fulvivirga sp. M361]
MKRIVGILSFILLVNVGVNAQERPKDGAVMVLSSSSIHVVPGTTQEVEIRLIRSKRYMRSKFGGLKARTPEGLDIIFTQDESTKDLYKMSITAADNADRKSHTIIIKGDGTNASKIKGVVISVNVSNDTMVDQAN